MDAHTLQCPACGAPCSPERRACAFCGNHLLCARCPHCTSLNFEGARLCAQCGTLLRAAPLGEKNALTCPRCKIALHDSSAGDLKFSECAACGGLFVDKEILIAATTTRERAATLGAPLPPIPVAPHAPAYLKCPRCQDLMTPLNFGRLSGAIVDVCRTDGTWFDAGELQRALSFVAGGGLEEALRREREELKHDAERDRQAHQVHLQVQALEHNERVHLGSFAVDLCYALGKLVWGVFT